MVEKAEEIINKKNVLLSNILQIYPAGKKRESKAPGDAMEPIFGKEGALYFKHGAFCLETQNYPDAVNHVISLFA